MTIRRAAIYMRVSTGEQTTENQRAELEELARRRGLEVAEVLEETISAGAPRRPALERLRELARKRRIAVVLVWALDRLTRGGALEALLLVHDLERAGVAVISAREAWLDTTRDNPFRATLIAIAGDIARLERERLRERTVAGVARARAEGKRIGRPPVPRLKLALATTLHRKEGFSIRQAAQRAGIGDATLRAHLAALAAPPGDDRRPSHQAGRVATPRAEKAP